MNKIKNLSEGAFLKLLFAFLSLCFLVAAVCMPDRNEMFSGLWNLDAVPICYANGYYRYIAGKDAYDAGHYEALAAILAPGEGEILKKKITQLLTQLPQEDML